MFNLISLFSIFKNSKILRYVVTIIIVSILLFFSYKYIYNKGYNDGSNYQKEILDKEYNELLQKRINENNIKLKNEYEEIIKSKEKDVKIKEVYIERKEQVKKVVEISKTLNEVELSDEEFNIFNKAIKRP